MGITPSAGARVQELAVQPHPNPVKLVLLNGDEPSELADKQLRIGLTICKLLTGSVDSDLAPSS